MLGMLVRMIFSDMRPIPPEYLVLRVMRWVSLVFAYTGIVALLLPIRSQRITRWIPPAVAILFVLLLVLMHFVVRRATDSGLSQHQIGNLFFSPHRFRIPGVLQRIGICYGIAATFALFCGWRSILASAVVMLILYSALMLKMPFPGHVTGVITHEDNLEHSIDKFVFDRPETNRKLTYGEYADPEGILSTIPATVTPMLGILLGLWLRRTDKTNVEKCAAMLAMGVFVAILGECLNAWLMPINKKIWSPSFVVFTAGLAMLGLGAIFWLVDVRGRKHGRCRLRSSE